MLPSSTERARSLNSKATLHTSQLALYHHYRIREKDDQRRLALSRLAKRKLTRRLLALRHLQRGG